MVVMRIVFLEKKERNEFPLGLGFGSLTDNWLQAVWERRADFGLVSDDEADVMVVMGVKHQGRVHGDTPRGGGDVLVSVNGANCHGCFHSFLTRHRL